MLPTQTTPPISAGDFSTTGMPVNLQQHLADYFYDPMQVENYRRLLRSMFTAYLPGNEERFGPFDREGFVHAYEVIDELFSGYVQLAANPVQA